MVNPKPPTPPAEDDSIPPLFIGPVTEASALPLALRLIPDSIAQQRQLAVSSVLLHPSTLAVLIAVVPSIFLLELPNRHFDVGARILAASAVCMIALLAARAAAGEYISVAEAFRVREYSTPRDVVLGARLGEGADEQWVGVLVLRVDEEAKRGVVRAWTTKLRYRRRGLGGDMVRLAVEETRRRCGGNQGVEVVIDEEHANGKRVLPGLYNGRFEERERKARGLLERVQRGMRKERAEKR